MPLLFLPGKLLSYANQHTPDAGWVDCGAFLTTEYKSLNLLSYESYVDEGDIFAVSHQLGANMLHAGGRLAMVKAFADIHGSEGQKSKCWWLEPWWRQLSYSQPKPFAPWVDEDEMDENYHPFNVNTLIYYTVNGKYYRALQSGDEEFPPPDFPLFWEEVPAPTMKWDTYPGFGGVGYFNEETFCTPQTYTIVIKDITDDIRIGTNKATGFNGIYYAKKIGGGSDGIWKLYHYRRFDYIIDIVFNLCEVKYDGHWWEWKYGEFYTELTGTASREIAYYDAGVTYAEGEYAKFWFAGHATDVFIRSLQDGNIGQDISDTDWWEGVLETEAMELKEFFHIKLEGATDSNINNYGNVMEKHAGANTSVGGWATNGTVSWYPGKILEWVAGTYAKDAVVIHSSRFYQASVETSEEPPHADWTLLT